MEESYSSELKADDQTLDDQNGDDRSTTFFGNSQFNLSENPEIEEEPEPVLVAKKILHESNIPTDDIPLVQVLKQRSKEEYALLAAGLGVVYFSWGVFGIHFNLSLMIIVCSLGYFIKSRLDRARKHGIVNILPSGLRRLLFRRSLFDVLCDLWYFPILPKYFKAILGPFIFKPTPEEAAKNFETLHPAFRKLFLTKGVINVLPSKAKAFLLPEDLLDVKQDQLKDSEDSTQENSDNFGSHQQNHSSNMSNDLPFIRIRDKEITIPSDNTIHGDTQLISCGQAVQDEIQRERVLKCLRGVVQEAYDKALQYHLQVAMKEQKSSLSDSPISYLKKFLKGSKHVSKEEKLALKKALLLAGFAIGVQLCFSRRSRQWMKNTLLLSLYLGSTAIGAGSLLLLAKHKQKSKKIRHHNHTEE